MVGLVASVLAETEARSSGETLAMVAIGAAIWYGLFRVVRAFVRRVRKGFGREDFSGGYKP